MSVDMFLEFDKSASITGETMDSGPNNHKATVQIDSFDFGVEATASAELGTGMGAGKVKFNDFNFKMKTSLASAPCFKSIYKGQHIPMAKLYLRKSGGKKLDYMMFQFKDLIITKYTIDGGSEDPVESITFAYTGLYVVYNQQTQTGDLGEKRMAGWNVKENDEWLV